MTNMRELPEPEGQLAWQTYTRDQGLAIQKQAYEDGLRDAAQICDELAELNRKTMTDSMWQQEECAAAIRTLLED